MAMNSERMKPAPTAQQLAEMGPEQAAHILSEIDAARAADLLRRIEINFAAALLPEISLSVALVLLSEVGQARATLLFENMNTERGAELLAEMGSEDSLRLLDDLDTSRAAELISVMPRGRATKILRDVTSERASRLLTEMPSVKAAKLLNELGFEFLARLVNTARATKVAPILQYVDRDLAAELLGEHCAEDRAAELLARMDASSAAWTLKKIKSYVANRIITQISRERMSELIGSFVTGKQIEILCELLAVDEAAYVLGHAEFEGLRFLVRDLPIDCLASMMMEMPRHERVLILALTGPFKDGILAKLPEPIAVDLAREVELPNLADQLTKIDPARAYMYLVEMNDNAGKLLSLMSSDAAARIIHAIESYDTTAEALNGVESSQVAWILRTMDIWEVAMVLDDMQADCAISALAESDTAFAEQVLSEMEKRASEKSYADQHLSPTEFEAKRAKRKKAVAHIREQLAGRELG
jgi:Mg/Co/Ni transporter MgtE